MTDPYAAPVHLADPIATVEAAVTLLRTGRTTMALTLLEGLPGQIAAAIAAAEPPPPSPTALQLEAAELTRLRAQARELVAEITRLRGERRQAEAGSASRRRDLG